MLFIVHLWFIIACVIRVILIAARGESSWVPIASQVNNVFMNICLIQAGHELYTNLDTIL